MSLDIKRIDGRDAESSLEVYFLNELEQAEKNGLKKIIIKKPQLMEYEDIIGQIFSYELSYHQKQEDKKKPFQEVWKLTGGKPHTIRKRRSGGGVEDEAGELFLEVVDENHLPNQENYVTDREVDELIYKHGRGVWRVGRFLIDSYGNYGRIKEFKIGSSEDEDLTKYRPIDNPHKTFVSKDDIKIVIEYERDVRINVNNPVFDRVETYSFNNEEFGKFEKKWHIIEDTDLIGYERKIFQAKEMESLDVFNEQIMIGTSQDEKMQKDMGSDSTALMGTKNQDQLQLLHDNIYKKTNMSKAVQCSFVRVITLKKEEFDILLDKEKEKMEMMKADLNYQITVFEKKMKKIQRLITTLEIYMGESENVTQIAEGENASADEPIALRQMMLYMDEEFGDPDNGGLDFKTIEEFDAWLVDSGNFERLIPEQKGVVVCQLRREDKDYGLNSWFDSAKIAELRAKNSRFYVLIRNGENLYKIWTDNVKFGKRLFPLKSELQEIMNNISEAQAKMSKSERDDYQFRNAEDKADEENDKLFYYQRTFLILQGIIMRTPIFNPIPKDFDFLNASTHGDTVKFIYDEENTLMDGRLRYHDYKEKLNSTIVKGSRVVITSNYNVKDYESRFAGYLSDRALHNIETPTKGLHNIKGRKIDDYIWKTTVISKVKWDTIHKEHELMKEKCKIVSKRGGSFGNDKVTYNFPSDYKMKYEIVERHYYTQVANDDIPKGSVQVYVLDDEGDKIKIDTQREELYISYSYEGEYSRKTVHKTFVIKKEDRQLINYDAVVLEDMDYYISNRYDRRNYVHMMPTFFKLRGELREELKAEEYFIMMTKGELLREYPSLGELDIETMIVDAIEWWKNKKATVWKRPISKDDGKALEMILQEVKRTCKKMGKKNINVGTNYKEALLTWRVREYTFFAYGITKKDFADQVKAIKETQYKFNYVKGFSKCADQVRGIRKPKTDLEKALMNRAKANKGVVDFKIC